MGAIETQISRDVARRLAAESLKALLQRPLADADKPRN
jgi:hypothetical protein